MIYTTSFTYAAALTGPVNTLYCAEFVESPFKDITITCNQVGRFQVSLKTQLFPLFL